MKSIICDIIEVQKNIEQINYILEGNQLCNNREKLIEKIRHILEEYQAECLFSYINPTAEEIQTAKAELNGEIPGDYRWFLEQYGEGGLDGLEIYGFNRLRGATFVHKTLLYRTYGLPEQLIVIENGDEWKTCIDTRTGKICLWSPGDTIGDVDIAYNDFLSYFYDELNNVIENL